MISICIPVYNFHVYNLVAELQKQANNINAKYEIICIDDFSDSDCVSANNNILDFPCVNYIKLRENIGRSKIRNLLAEKANYKNLLFIDCDSEIIKDDYLEKFINNISSNSVIYGGRIHSSVVPNDKKLYLRWLYGRKREDIPFKSRKLDAYISFKTNNFLIQREVLLDIKFNESIKGYGHEDTLFALQLKDKNIPLHHIDNSVVHIGLETAEDFLKKTIEAIENLELISSKFSKIISEIKILRVYHKMKKNKLTVFMKIIHPLFSLILKRNLLSNRPKLFFFDMYKLSFLFYYSK